MDNCSVSCSRLSAVGLDEDAGCTGRAVLDSRLPAMGLSRLVSPRGRNLRTRFDAAFACAASRRLRREPFLRRDARRDIYSCHARRNKSLTF